VDHAAKLWHFWRECECLLGVWQCIYNHHLFRCCDCRWLIHSHYRGCLELIILLVLLHITMNFIILNIWHARMRCFARQNYMQSTQKVNFAVFVPWSSRVQHDLLDWSAERLRVQRARLRAWTRRSAAKGWPSPRGCTAERPYRWWTTQSGKDVRQGTRWT